MTGPVGIREVAERAGVSIGTVSNVLNKPEIVAKSTRERVQSIIEDMGFVRNDLARQLKMGRGKTLGMIVLSVANPFFADLAHACESAAEEVGYTVILGSSDHMQAREDRYMDLFEEQRVSGLLITPSAGATERMKNKHDRGMRMVLFDALADQSEFCTVALDGLEGGKLAVQHLVDTGRKRIAFVAGASYLIEDRWTGAQWVCDNNPGVSLERIDTVDQSVAAGHATGEAIAALPAHQRPDAIFAGTDQLAIGLMQALVLADDIDVPRDIAIIGYDDIDYAASAIIPLTTIRQPTDAIAREAIRLIEADSQLEPHDHERIRLMPELIVRASTPVVS
jgi:LacI family transcriptional regulator